MRPHVRAHKFSIINHGAELDMGTAAMAALGAARQSVVVVAVVVVAVVVVGSMSVKFPGKLPVGEKLANPWWFQPSPLSDRLAWTEPTLDCPSDWALWRSRSEKRGQTRGSEILLGDHST